MTDFSLPFSVGGVPILSGLGGGVVAFRKVYFVDGTFGNDSNTGLSVEEAKATVQAACNVVRDEDTIIVMRGSYDEKIQTGQNIRAGTGAVNMVDGRGRYVNLIGVAPTKWAYNSPQLYNESLATYTLEIRSPGWRISGFRLVGDPTCTRIMQIWWAQPGNTADTNWAPGTQVDNCVFYGAVGSCSGLNIQGVPDVRILDNIFELFDTAALPALESVGTAVAPTNRSTFIGNQFLDNVENMDIALNASLVRGNSFGGNHVNTMTIGLNLANGNDNIVTENYFAGDYSTSGGRYVAGSGDDWAGNYSMDTGETEVGDNGLTIAIPAAP